MVIIRLSVELHCVPKVTSVWCKDKLSQVASPTAKWFESRRECHYNHIYLHLFSPSWSLFKSFLYSTLWQRVTFPALPKAGLKANGLLGQHGVLFLPKTALGKPDWPPARWNAGNVFLEGGKKNKTKNLSPSICVIMWEFTYSTDFQLNRSTTKTNATKNS